MVGFFFRGLRKCALLLFGVSTALFISCGSDSADERAKLAKLAEGCLIDSDCKAPLVCAFKKCHTKCNDDRDCEGDEICTPTEERPIKVCLISPDEVKCVYNTDCPADHLKCALDHRCRTECRTEKDCVPLQKCVQGSCADDKHIEDGKLVPPNGPGPDASVGTGCTYNTDCVPPLVCKAGACLVECKGDRDCPTGLLCDSNGSCVLPGQSDGGVAIPSCVNGKQDPGETGLDCGGGCGACDGDPCTKPLDCASNVCQGLKCAAPTCGDGLQNGTESDIDCGGGCPKCPPTKGCWTSNDCTTGSCVGGSCNAPGCSNGTKDTNETDVDCGGTECKPCETGKGCEKNSDCSSANCVAKKCVKAGPTLWTRVIDGSGSDTVKVAASSPGHVVIAGDFSKGAPGIDLGGGALLSSGNAVYVAKYKASGAHAWSRVIGSSYMVFGDVAVGSGGDVWVWSRQQFSMALPGAKPSCTAKVGSWVGQLAKLDSATGDDVWSACVGILGTSGSVQVETVHADAQGDVHVSGTFFGTIDLDQTQLSSPYTHGFIAKYSRVTGDLAWASHINSPTNGLGEVMSFASDATHTYAVGRFGADVSIGTGTPVLLKKASAQKDIFIAKMDSTGKVVDSRTIGGPGPDSPVRAVVSGGELWVAGLFEGQVSFGATNVITAKGGRDIFVARFSTTDLTTLDAMSFGANANEELGGFDVAPNGEFVITGSIREAHNFGGGPLAWKGGEDFFYARFSKTGVYQGGDSQGGLGKEQGLSAAYLGQSLFIGGGYASTVTIDFGTGALPVPPSSFDAFVVFFP